MPIPATQTPWIFQLHLGAWLAIVVLSVGYAAAVRAPERRATPRQVASFYGGLALLIVAVTWPIADLAAHWSLMALVAQRLLLMVAVAPLLLLGTPVPVLARLTRPAPVDAFVRTCTRPAVAVGIVTVIAVGTLTTGVVTAQSSSPAARGLLDLLLLFAGVVLWSPFLERFPGTARMSPLGRSGYLIVQSIVPSFLAVVWFFAHHSLYPTFDHAARPLAMSPLTDQQVAGFVAKLGTIAVLWSVAFVAMSRAHDTDGREKDDQPLTWADVERHLERADRHDRRRPRATGGPGGSPPGLPPSSGPGAPDQLPHEPGGPGGNAP